MSFRCPAFFFGARRTSRNSPRSSKPLAGRIGVAVWAAVIASVGTLPGSAWAESTIFGGGPCYGGGTSTMNALRASGYKTVMLWCIHVDAETGNLIFNDQLVVANGACVGNAAWPGQLATLKAAPTSVKRIELSVSSWGVNDFQAIQTLMNTYGTNTDSILYRNFRALKNATGADAIDYDDETLYDVDTGVKFGRMLSSLGYKVTLVNTWNGTNLSLSWPGNGTLLEATDLSGPWTTNLSVSPVTVSPLGPQQFYRILTQ